MVRLSLLNKKVLNLRASIEPNNRNRPKGRGIDLDPAKKSWISSAYNFEFGLKTPQI